MHMRTSIRSGEIAGLLLKGNPLRLRDLPASPEEILRVARSHPAKARVAAEAIRHAIEWHGGATRQVLDLLEECERLAQRPALLC